MLDEATTRATAIHDGAERRLNLLTSRHTETMRRLTEIRDVVTNLVSSETARGSLEEEVAKSVATASGTTAPASTGRTAAEARQMPGRGGARDSAARSADTARPGAAHPGQHAANTEERSPATAKATRPAQDATGSQSASESTRSRPE
jgi:hypothetical protein